MTTTQFVRACVISWLSPSNPRALITGSWGEVVRSPLYTHTRTHNPPRPPPTRTHTHTHTHFYLLPRFDTRRRNGIGGRIKTEEGQERMGGRGRRQRSGATVFFFFSCVKCLFPLCYLALIFSILPPSHPFLLCTASTTTHQTNVAFTHKDSKHGGASGCFSSWVGPVVAQWHFREKLYR